MKVVGVLDTRTRVLGFYERVMADRDPLVGMRSAVPGLSLDESRDVFTAMSKVCEILRDYPAYVVSSEMWPLVTSAVRGFPEWNPIPYMPGPGGFTVLPAPIVIELQDGDGIRHADVEAFAWLWGEAGGKRVLCVNLFSRRDGDDDVIRTARSEYSEDEWRHMPPYVVASLVIFTPHAESAQDGTAALVGRYLGALWALMDQRVLETQPAETPRAERRAAARAGVNPSVLVVQLRRTIRQHLPTDGGGFVDWSCRWLVSGHWRNQWYPSKSKHGLKWIAPYTKGPDDKPLQVKERVYALVR